MSNEATRTAPDLREIHSRLQALYKNEYPEGAPNLYESLLTKLPAYIQALVLRKIDLLIQSEMGEEQTHSSLKKDDKRALSMFLNPQVLSAHLDIGRDSALSNDHHTIAHFDTQPPIVAHDLIDVASNEHPERLERMGCVFFDVDGTKTLVDCTSHAHAGKYLEGLAEFLCKLPESIMTWLQENNLKAEVFSYAGDEFVMILRSEEKPVTKELLDEFAFMTQEAMKIDPILTSFVSFDDPEFAMEYDEWTDAERAQYKKDLGSMRERLSESRGKLPEKFIPSVSCGTATFMESLEEALSPDTEEAKTLEDLGKNAFRLMVSKADERLKQDKRIFRENMEDPKWKAFLLRNSENRRLQSEILQLKRGNEELRSGKYLAEKHIEDLKRINARYLRHIHELQTKAAV